MFVLENVSLPGLLQNAENPSNLCLNSGYIEQFVSFMHTLNPSHILYSIVGLFSYSAI